MTNPITVLAPIKLAAGKIETDLLAASDRFQRRQPDGNWLIALDNPRTDTVA